MTITQFFESLGAPLTNQNWSWGAERKADGAIFLRVWTDEMKSVERHKWAMVAHHVRGGGSNLGYRERMQHLEMVQAGAQCFVVLIDPTDPATTPGPRRIFRYDARIVGVGGRIETEGDRTWLHITGYKMVADIRLPSPKSSGI